MRQLITKDRDIARSIIIKVCLASNFTIAISPLVISYLPCREQASMIDVN
ncbi:MAG: hypothetical protein U9R02_09430 [Thermodesulfobacteriota bacterium]|nr:hypothetical protein [Thermodesulfobacteriota bacterium]